MRRRFLAALLVAACAWLVAAAQELTLPVAPTSVKFAVIGDSGTGDPEQYQLADQMARFHAKFTFDRVIMLRENIYGGQTPQDLVKKFAQPYKALLPEGQAQAWHFEIFGADTFQESFTRGYAHMKGHAPVMSHS